MDIHFQSLHVNLFIWNGTIRAHTHFNILTHFLWEGPTEPRHPSLCTAAVSWTTTITVPQWVFTYPPHPSRAILLLSCHRPVIPDSQNNLNRQRQEDFHQGAWHRDSIHIAVDLSALHGGTLQPVVAWWRRRITAEDLSAGLGWFVGRQSQRTRAERFFCLELSNFLLYLTQCIHQVIIQPL